jgi:hypothetical protein
VLAVVPGERNHDVRINWILERVPLHNLLCCRMRVVERNCTAREWLVVRDA